MSPGPHWLFHALWFVSSALSMSSFNTMANIYGHNREYRKELACVLASILFAAAAAAAAITAFTTKP